MKKTLFILPIVISTFSFTACNKQKEKTPKLENYAIHHDDEFGGAYINIGIQEFNDLGFAFGDSVNLVFTTGDKTVKYEDIGYYSGYYVPAGQELVVGYKGYENIKFCINYGEDVYAEHEFNENTKVTITINEVGKYKDVEETLSISYSDDRKQYTSDEQFANFREVNVGQIQPKMLYRGASPIDNSRSRSAIVDELLEKNNIQYNIDLADKESAIGGSKYTIHNYFKGLQSKNKVVFLGMAAAYKAEDFTNKMKTLFLSMLENDGPYYVHCLEGKDRTGYVCMVLEALCGASYQELIDDYFITYKNYYGIEEGTKKYEVIKQLHIDEMIKYVFGFEKQGALTFVNFHSMANNYMLNVGLSQEQINQLQKKLCSNNNNPDTIQGYFFKSLTTRSTSSLISSGSSESIRSIAFADGYGI